MREARRKRRRIQVPRIITGNYPAHKSHSVLGVVAKNE